MVNGVVELKMEHVLMLLGAYLVYHFFLRRCPFYELDGFQCEYPETCTKQEDCDCGRGTPEGRICDSVTKKCQNPDGDTGWRYCKYNPRKWDQEGECQMGPDIVTYGEVGWTGSNSENKATKLGDCKTVDISFFDPTWQREEECEGNIQRIPLIPPL